jgi:putative ABC transport system permease protein
MATVTGAVWSVLDDADTFAGSFDISATTLRISPITDMDAAISASPDLNGADFSRLSQQSILSVQVRQVGATSDEFKDYLIRGDDAAFLSGNTFDFTLMAPEYTTAAEVWAAVAANLDLAVIDAMAIPSRTNFNVGVVGQGFVAEGVYLEDEVFKPFEVEVRDPFSETTRTVKVIAVLQNSLSPLIFGISTSQATMEAAFGRDAATPTIHLFDVREGVNVGETAKQLEAAFAMNGMNAEPLRKQQQDIMSSSLTFNYMLQGFMGLGLVVGVAALGVISARSVVERRQQIGVLRAIGFQKGMVELSFLLESSFIALLGIGVGTVLGLIIAANVIHDFSQTGGHGSMPFAVPWLNLAVIFGAAYIVALMTTFLPARQAARIYPAEALRYE